MKIIMRATYEELEWPEEGDPDYVEGDNQPRRTGGYTDPHNPWGGLDSEIPEGLCGEPFSIWREENVEPLVFDDDDPSTLDDGEFDDDGVWRDFSALEVAARFIVDFPGAVWDLWEGEYSMNFRTGIERGVTLHVEVAPDPFTQLLLAGMTSGPLMGLLDPLPRLFAEAERLQAANDAHLRALTESRYV